MDYIILQTTDDPHQVFYLPTSPDGHAFQAKLDLQYLPAPGLWILSIADAITGQVYVPNIPVICSWEEINDLLFPFRFLFPGSGIGSLFCLKATESPSSQNPSRGNLNEFQLIWGDILTADSIG